jgi:hypothetical protein
MISATNTAIPVGRLLVSDSVMPIALFGMNIGVSHGLRLEMEGA